MRENSSNEKIAYNYYDELERIKCAASEGVKGRVEIVDDQLLFTYLFV